MSNVRLFLDPVNDFKEFEIKCTATQQSFFSFVGIKNQPAEC